MQSTATFCVSKNTKYRPNPTSFCSIRYRDTHTPIAKYPLTALSDVEVLQMLSRPSPIHLTPNLPFPLLAFPHDQQRSLQALSRWQEAQQN